MDEPTNLPYCYLPKSEYGIHLKCNRGLCCRKHTEKVNVVFNSNGTVSYQEKNSFTFVPERSAGHWPNQEYLTVPNIPLLVSQLSYVHFFWESERKLKFDLVRICILTVTTEYKKHFSRNTKQTVFFSQIYTVHLDTIKVLFTNWRTIELSLKKI